MYSRISELEVEFAGVEVQVDQMSRVAWMCHLSGEIFLVATVAVAVMAVALVVVVVTLANGTVADTVAVLVGVVNYAVDGESTIPS